MSYQTGQPQPYAYPVPPPPPIRTDSSKRILNMSAAAFISVITGILLVCCVGPIALCFLSPVLGGIVGATKTKPDLAITSCQMGQLSSLRTATVGFQITNKSTATESYLVRFEIRDPSGARVGDGTEWVRSLAPGSSATEEAVVFLDSSNGLTCHIVSVD